MKYTIMQTPYDFTTKELRIIQHITNHTYKQTAALLHMDIDDVARTAYCMMKKCGVRSVKELRALAKNWM